jgi:microcystin-dependent protein
MSEPFIAELRVFPFSFAPKGWALCNGQVLLISQNQALFALLGTTYGGDGQSTFALPDLRGRLPIHQGNGYVLSETGGAETVTLTANQMPAHSHAVQASAQPAETAKPEGRYLAQPNDLLYGAPPADQAMSSSSVGVVGGSQPHDNLQPYLCVDFIISLFGIYPSPA